MKHIFSIIIVIYISNFMNVNAQVKIHYQNSNSRALSMAGAFTSVQDYHNSLYWNPAGLILAKDRSEYRNSDLIKVNFDIPSLYVAFMGLAIHSISHCGEDYEDEDEEETPYCLQLFAYSFRGITFINRDNFLVSLNLHEDLIDYETSYENILDNSYQTLITSYEFGRELSIGSSFNYYQVYHDSVRISGFGLNLGIQYNSTKCKGLTYGLSYFKFQDNVKYVRSRVERIFDNSLTFGICYNYHEKLIVAMDIKNINDINKKYFCESHFGFEEELSKSFYLRQGFYLKNNFINNVVTTFGLGYRTHLFETLKEKYLNIGLGFLFDDKKPMREFEATITLRVGF